jgi:hypothetical protein
MKRIIMLAAAALLVSGAAFAGGDGKCKKSCKKECKDAKAKDSKEKTKDSKTSTVKA